MWTKLTAWWASLPHQVQAVLVGFGGGAGGVIEKVVEQWATGQVVCSGLVLPCLETYCISALKAGVIAVMGLYIKSSYHKQ